jgi:hypothetical protein
MRGFRVAAMLDAMHRHLVFAAVLLAACALAPRVPAAHSSAPPVGPLPRGPVATIEVETGALFAIALPKPGTGLSWRGARQSDATIARPVDEGELNGNIVFTYRAGHAGATTVVYALTRGELPAALQVRFFHVVVFPARCATTAAGAASYVIPPAPFVARLVSVQRLPRASGASRLYRVTFHAVRGNAVLPSGHTYTQFAYVARGAAGRWCFLKGGSGI